MPSFFVTSGVFYILYFLTKILFLYLYQWLLTLMDQDGMPNMFEMPDIPGAMPASPSPSPPPPPPARPSTPETQTAKSPESPNKKRWAFVGDPAVVQAYIGLGLGLPVEPTPFDSVVHETQETPGNVEGAGKEQFKRALSERQVPPTPDLPPWVTPPRRNTEWGPIPFDPYNPPFDPHRRLLVGDFWRLEAGMQAQRGTREPMEYTLLDLINRRGSPDSENASTAALYGSDRGYEDNFEDLAGVDDASPISMSSLSSLSTSSDSDETSPLLGNGQRSVGQQQGEIASPVNLEGARCMRPHPRIHPLYAARYGNDPNWNFAGPSGSQN
ncbi:hypothetical protein GGS26DRAFT_593770 [Hypomontagnella submonticulosa]|nr:hypothetical protein GGS26DRAFT_593770 [Hypomontagnella submonticulosa]